MRSVSVIVPTYNDGERVLAGEGGTGLGGSRLEEYRGALRRRVHLVARRGGVTHFCAAIRDGIEVLLRHRGLQRLL